MKDDAELQSYDVVPSILTEQHELIGWSQVLPSLLSLHACIWVITSMYISMYKSCRGVKQFADLC